MAEVTYRITGDVEVQQALESLPRRVQNKILRPLLREGAKTIATAQKSQAPQESGLLEKALGQTSVKSYRRGSMLFTTAGVRRGFKRAINWHHTKKRSYHLKIESKKFTGDSVMMRDPVKYAHIVAGGRKAVQAKKGSVLYSRVLDAIIGTRARATTPNPFIARAFDQAKTAVVSRIITQAEPAIVAEAARRA